MRYLTLLVVVLVLWVLVEKMVLTDTGARGRGTLRGKLQDFARYIHWLFGIVAAALLGLMVVRLIIAGITWQ